MVSTIAWISMGVVECQTLTIFNVSQENFDKRETVSIPRDDIHAVGAAPEVRAGKLNAVLQGRFKY